MPERKTFITSDNHFGHTNIIKYCNRPFNSANHMDQMMVHYWNMTVSMLDTVYVVGDFTLGKNAKEYLRKLNGRKILIKGNHDVRPSIEQGWAEVHTNMFTMPYGTYELIMHHYPKDAWANSYGGSILLHGHVHNTGTNPNKLRRYDVGVDGHNYTPQTIEQILENMQAQGLL